MDLTTIPCCEPFEKHCDECAECGKDTSCYVMVHKVHRRNKEKKVTELRIIMYPSETGDPRLCSEGQNLLLGIFT